jgi:hypothetical protein
MNEEFIKNIEDKIEDIENSIAYYELKGQFFLKGFCQDIKKLLLTELKKQNEKSCENCAITNDCDSQVIRESDYGEIVRYDTIDYCSNYKEVVK